MFAWVGHAQGSCSVLVQWAAVRVHIQPAVPCCHHTTTHACGKKSTALLSAMQEVPQIYAACGRGPRSTLRMLRPGLSVSEVAVTEVPARPTAVWTVRRSHDDPYDDLIVISFADDKATLVLRVGDTVQEVNDSGLEGKTATIGMQLLANNSTLQVHQGGLRHINLDRRINKWAPPGRRSVTACALNKEQVWPTCMHHAAGTPSPDARGARCQLF